MTEGRCFLHSFEDDWEVGGMVQWQGKTPFFHGGWEPSLQGRLQRRRRRRCTASALATTLEMGSLFFFITAAANSKCQANT